MLEPTVPKTRLHTHHTLEHSERRTSEPAQCPARSRTDLPRSLCLLCSGSLAVCVCVCGRTCLIHPGCCALCLIWLASGLVSVFTTSEPNLITSGCTIGRPHGRAETRTRARTSQLARAEATAERGRLDRNGRQSFWNDTPKSSQRATIGCIYFHRELRHGDAIGGKRKESHEAIICTPLISLIFSC